jgi:uncharacterized protein
MTELLAAPVDVNFPYTRSLGPVLSRFLTGLKEGRIEGVRAKDGRVLVPPPEYDPLTSEDLDEFVEVGQEGEVVTWAWLDQPLQGQPLDRPFAWALVRLDGADVPMIHAVDTGGDASAVSTGMRVRVRWRPEAEREGHIRDIECFVPAGA